MMTTTPNPTEAQIEKAARAFFREYHGEDIWPELRDDGELDTRSRALAATRAALVAAGVAPQEPSQNETKSGNNFVSLDPEKGAAHGAAPQVESADCDRDRMGICKRCGMGWDARKVLEGDFACPVLTPSGVDDEKLAEVIGRDENYTSDLQLGGWTLSPRLAARAVAEWLKGQG